MATRSKFYKGNPLLPKAYEQYEYTPDQEVEIARCIMDPVYFAEKYFRIVHVDRGLIPFTLYEYQKRAIMTMQDSRHMLMCASRQCGKTSVATVMLLHAALFNKQKEIGLLANKAATAREILKRIKKAYEYIPTWMKPGVKEWNKSSVEFENGSVIIADATEGDSIRGHSLYMLYIDEMAFVENWDEFAGAVLPTLSSGETTKIVMTSTPKGLNHFYYYVEGARTGKNDYKLIEVPWTEVPGRDEKWRAKALAELNGNEEKFAQEYNLEFMGSSGTLINGQTLKSLMFADPLFKDPHLKIYEQPRKHAKYALVADVSRGKGLDFSAFSVVDITSVPFKQVCAYRNNMITPSDYAGVINQIGRHFNTAHVLVEINDMGESVTDVLHMHYEYPELLTTESRGRAGKQISAGYGKNIDRGVRTTKPVKAMGCGMLKLLVEQRKLLINDKDTIAELTTFSQKGTSYEAEPGNHDDMVMGLVLFSWLAEQDYFKLLVDTDLQQALRETSDEDLEDSILPLGIVVNANTFDYYDDDGYESLGSRDMGSSDPFDSWL